MKTIFQKSISEIREDQKNLTGGFGSDPNLAEKVYNICRHLESNNKVDQYISGLKEPLAILFLVNINSKHKIYVLGDDSGYSFWYIESLKSAPMPIASTNEIQWSPDLNKLALYEESFTSSSPIAPIVHIYDVNYF